MPAGGREAACIAEPVKVFGSKSGDLRHTDEGQAAYALLNLF